MFTLFTRISVLSFLIGSSWLRAGIAWEKTEVEVTPEKEDEPKIEVPFPFRVGDGQSVQILDVGSSCGCTVPTLEKRLYSPGESGILAAVFTPGSRQGRQTKHLTVKTVEAGKETQTKLTLVVNLPEWAKPEASRLEWGSGENTIKSLKVNIKPGTKLVIKQRPSPAAERFNVELKPDISGQFYLLEATPVPDKSRGLTPVFINIFRGDAHISSMTLLLLSR
jgi:hypothetical protein